VKYFTYYFTSCQRHITAILKFVVCKGPAFFNFDPGSLKIVLINASDRYIWVCFLASVFNGCISGCSYRCCHYCRKVKLFLEFLGLIERDVSMVFGAVTIFSYLNLHATTCNRKCISTHEG